MDEAMPILVDADEPRSVLVDADEPRSVLVDADEPLSVLVVEDDPLIGQVIEVTLEEAGYAVFWHELGRPAVAAAADLQPCAVLLDLMLPDMDGQEVLRFLRRDPRTEGIPVVIVSAISGTLTDDERGMVQAILPKPFTIDRLVETVRSVQRTGPAEHAT